MLLKKADQNCGFKVQSPRVLKFDIETFFFQSWIGL